jgi:hypothetical protein
MIDEGPPARITLCFQDEESDYNPGRGPLGAISITRST